MGPVRQVRVSRALRAVCYCGVVGALLVPLRAAVADDVEITSDVTTGVNLDSFSGTTAKIFAGVTVSNANVAVPAVSATTQAWTLTNDGTIGPTVFGDGVKFGLGGTVINSGSIDGFNGIWLGQGPGTVNNLDGGTIHGSAGAVVCSFIGSCGGAVDVTNAGDITSDGADAVALSAGGTVTNYAGGLIQSDGSNAVSILFGATREITNSGTILSTAATAAGVSIDGGKVTNNAGGEITGTFNGVWAHAAGGATTVINDGLIEATEADFDFGVPGSAIELDSGGTIANTGTIRSSSTNSTDAAIYSAGATTVTNSGTIASLTGGQGDPVRRQRAPYAEARHRLRPRRQRCGRHRHRLAGAARRRLGGYRQVPELRDADDAGKRMVADRFRRLHCKQHGGERAAHRERHAVDPNPDGQFRRHARRQRRDRRGRHCRRRHRAGKLDRHAVDRRHRVRFRLDL